MDNLFNISAMEKSETAHAVEIAAPVETVQPATPTDAAAPPAPVPAAPAGDAVPGAPAADPAPNNEPPTPSNTVTDLAPAPLPAADPVSTVPDAETEAARQKQQLYLDAQESARKALLSELGVDSVDELKSWKKPEAEETPEQKQRREEMYRANVQRHAIHKLNMKTDDFVQIQNAQEATDDALVFSAFKDKWMPLAKEDPAYQGKDLDTEARFLFEQMFHLNSENEALQKIGALSLKENASMLRSDLQAKYTTAESHYRDFQSMRTDMGNFKTLLEGKLASIPLDRKWQLEDGGEVAFQLSKLDRDDLRSHLLTDETFLLFQQKGGQETAQQLDRQIENYIRAKFFDDMMSTTIKTVRDITASKAVAGARAPFPITPGTPAPVITTGQITKEDDAKVAALFGRP